MVVRGLIATTKFIKIAENRLFYHSFGLKLMKNEKKTFVEKIFLWGLTPSGTPYFYKLLKKYSFFLNSGAYRSVVKKI